MQDFAESVLEAWDSFQICSQIQYTPHDKQQLQLSGLLINLPIAFTAISSSSFH